MNSSNWEVPKYSITEVSPKRSKYCVCIPVINEGLKIQAQLERMKWLAQNIDIIIADGGSTDNSLTLDVLSNAGVRVLLTKQDYGKLSAQLRMAFAYALKQGYEGIITIDGNNKDDPNAIPAFIAALDDGFDHIQGSRFIRGGKAINTPWARLIGIKLIHAPLISLAAGCRYTDTTNGFRAYSRRLLLDSRVAPFRKVFSAYELHYYLAIRSARLGYRIKELPVTRKYPAKGPIPTKISPLRGNSLVMLTLFKACFHKFDPRRKNVLDRGVSMSKALIGYTGFVGSNLAYQTKFDSFYNSKNIESITGKEFDLIVCAGAPAVKWLANKEPVKDLASIERLTKCLGQAAAKKVILISTVDVYPSPVAVNEDTEIDTADLHSYGKHRLHLENLVKERFDTLVVRLPGLFGDGLKKNIIYDLLHKNCIDQIHKDSKFQFYYLAYLWHDIQTLIQHNLQLVNLATEPTSVWEVADAGFGLQFTNEPQSHPAEYDMRSKYSKLFSGNQSSYMYKKQQVLSDIKDFVAKQKVVKNI